MMMAIITIFIKINFNLFIEIAFIPHYPITPNFMNNFKSLMLVIIVNFLILAFLLIIINYFIHYLPLIIIANTHFSIITFIVVFFFS